MNDGAIVKNEEEVKCPHCGHQNYEVMACRTVCINVTPIIRDGVMINRKPDGEETDCKCLYCGERFTYRKKIFEVKKVVTETPKPVEAPKQEPKVEAMKAEEPKLEVKQEVVAPKEQPKTTTSKTSTTRKKAAKATTEK